MTPKHARLALIRHGETEWSANGRHTSRTDLELTGRGVAEAKAVGPILTGLLGGPPALALSSPMRRARHTAELLGIPVEVTQDLVEVQYGDYEGLTTPQIRETEPGWTVWTGSLPGGETLTDAGARCDRVLDRVRPVLDDGPVVLFAHGHILRVLAARWLGLAPSAGVQFMLGTAAACLLSYEREEPAILHWNLPNPAATH